MIRNRLCLSLICLGIVATGFADQVVYSTKLENGWQDWSWAKVTKSGPKLTVNSKSWQGLYFHHNSQSSKGVKAIQFTVAPGIQGGQKLFVHATVDKKPLKETVVIDVSPKAGVVASIKPAQLGLHGQPFDGFWIQGSDKPMIFVASAVKIVQ